jgi:sortase A
VARAAPRSGERIAVKARLAAAVVAALFGVGLVQAGHGLFIPLKAHVAQHLLVAAWTEARRGDARPGDAIGRPWPWADTQALARLSAPALGEAWIVLSGASGRNLAFAPAHLDGSALPGRPGLAVIAGHRDTHFAALAGAEIGDALEVELPSGVVHRYVVSSIDVVDADDTRLRLDSAAPLLMLVTCYPFEALAPRSTLRYVVTAVHAGAHAAPAAPPT